MNTIHQLNAGKFCLRVGDFQGPFYSEKYICSLEHFFLFCWVSHGANFDQVKEISLAFFVVDKSELNSQCKRFVSETEQRQHGGGPLLEKYKLIPLYTSLE